MRTRLSVFCVLSVALVMPSVSQAGFEWVPPREIPKPRMEKPIMPEIVAPTRYRPGPAVPASQLVPQLLQQSEKAMHRAPAPTMNAQPNSPQMIRKSPDSFKAYPSPVQSTNSLEPIDLVMPEQPRTRNERIVLTPPQSMQAIPVSTSAPAPAVASRRAGDFNAMDLLKKPAAQKQEVTRDIGMESAPPPPSSFEAAPRRAPRMAQQIAMNQEFEKIEREAAAPIAINPYPNRSDIPRPTGRENIVPNRVLSEPTQQAKPLVSMNAPSDVRFESFPAPITTPAPASRFGSVEGFGNDIPLAMAMQQIVPSDYAYYFGEGVSPSTPVSWNGGKPWNMVVADMIAPAGMRLDVQGNVISIKRY